MGLLVGLAGCHAQAGPVFGYAFGEGFRAGWEAGGGGGPFQGSVGQSFGRFQYENAEADFPAGEAEPVFESRFGYATYLAAEPGIGVGGTLGLSLRNDGDLEIVGGGWAGYPSMTGIFGRTVNRVDGGFVKDGGNWKIEGWIAKAYLKDGDEYRLTVTDPLDGAVLIDVRQTVAYSRFELNGPGCGE